MNHKLSANAKTMTGVKEILDPFFAGKDFPDSVIEVGITPSGWLDYCASSGSTDLLGFYQSPEKNPSQNQLVQFKKHDFSDPWEDETERNLCICLETAQLVPPEMALRFIGQIALSAPICFFSAPPPHQESHKTLNARPPLFWAQLFRDFGMKCFDPRPLIWDNSALDARIRQNLLVFINTSLRYDPSPLPESVSPPHIIHPEIFRQRMTSWQSGQE